MAGFSPQPRRDGSIFPRFLFRIVAKETPGIRRSSFLELRKMDPSLSCQNMSIRPRVPASVSRSGIDPAFSTIRITVRRGARARCTTVRGTVEPWPRREFEWFGPCEQVLSLEVNQQRSVDDIKELVVLVVLLPVILALDHARLRTPTPSTLKAICSTHFVFAGVRQRFDVDDLPAAHAAH